METALTVIITFLCLVVVIVVLLRFLSKLPCPACCDSSDSSIDDLTEVRDCDALDIENEAGEEEVVYEDIVDDEHQVEIEDGLEDDDEFVINKMEESLL